MARLVGIVSLSAVLLVIGGFVFLAWELHERARRDAAAEIDSTAYLLASHAERLFEVSDIALRSATAAIGALDWNMIGSSRQMFEQLNAAQGALPYVEDIWLNDETGQLRLTTFAFPTPESNASDREAFKAQLQPTDRLFVGDRIIGRVTQKPTFLLARRLEHADGRFRGMVSVTADLSYFSDFWSRMHLPFDAKVTLLRTPSLGVLAQFPLPATDAEFVSHWPAGLVQTFAANPLTGHLEFLSPIGRGPALGAYQRLGELPLYLVVSVSEAAVTAGWRERMMIYGGFVALAVTALLVLTAVAFRQARREEEVTAALRRAETELRESNTRLEAMVGARTAELSESNEEIQRFAYIVSHDLRAPLVNITGFTSELEFVTERLRTELKDNPKGDSILADFTEALTFIRTAITKMDGLINAILKISRDGQRNFRPEPLDMNAVLQGLANVQKHQADAAAATIEIGTLPDIRADKLAVEQIFGNLIDNAIKYLDAQRRGRIAVQGREHGQFAVYTVKDNGRGIAKQDFARVFELFRRSGVQDRPGEGIGLAHVRTMVRALGGRIDLESEFGVGSTFTVRLPKLPPAPGR